MKKITESPSLYDKLELKSSGEILTEINTEDLKVAAAVGLLIPKIEKFINALEDKMLAGGRLFYIGAGTSGRLGILDASECPPTFGVPHSLVTGIIAGGDQAIRKAVEFAEDDYEQAWKDLQSFDVTHLDSLVGIAASGTTPYVIGGVEAARKNGLLTACICCNAGSPLAEKSEHPLEAIVGPEYVTGSTRMKSGTAQKMILNMISTTVMIKLGRVEGNRMVDMHLSNKKLEERGANMVAEKLGISFEKAFQLLKKYGSVRKAVLSGK
ncbi:MAG: N-acetylmuramic acid 6-phosphate etherase [Chitinophagaceae bacterium]|nr:MAG: N-acetylmuramic acid 6-phosphate etherase [Chitinophagaceae bacterium]